MKTEERLCTASMEMLIFAESWAVYKAIPVNYKSVSTQKPFNR